MIHKNDATKRRKRTPVRVVGWIIAMAAALSPSSSSASPFWRWEFSGYECEACSTLISAGHRICSSCFDRRIKQACKNRLGLLPGMPRAVCIQPSSFSQTLQNDTSELSHTSSTAATSTKDERLLDFLTTTPSNLSGIDNPIPKSARKSVRFNLVQKDSVNESTPKSLESAVHSYQSEQGRAGSDVVIKKKVRFQEKTVLLAASDNEKPRNHGLPHQDFVQLERLESPRLKQGTPLLRSNALVAQSEIGPVSRARFLGSLCGTPRSSSENNSAPNFHHLQDISYPLPSWYVSCTPLPGSPRPAASTCNSDFRFRVTPSFVSENSNPLWKRRQLSRPILGLQLEAAPGLAELPSSS